MHLFRVFNVILIVAILPNFGTAQLKLTPGEEAQVEKYLREIQTDSLLVEYLESQIAQETNIDARRKLVSRLLTRYAQNMMTGRKVVGSDWRKKSELLLAIYPDLETPTLRIAIIQAQYVENENEFRVWWRAGQSIAEKSKLTQKWQELHIQLKAINRNLEGQYQAQIASAQSQNRSPESQELIQTEGLILHTNYLLGWTSYFSGVLIREERKDYMKQADVQFREFLQIDQKKALSTLDASWFDFSSRWQLRAFVGLSMVQRGLNYPNQAKFCFEMIGEHAQTQLDQDRRPVWEFHSHLYLGQTEKAIELVEGFAANPATSRSSSITFWNATLDGAIGLRDQAPQLANRLLKFGLIGLAQEFDGHGLNRFLESQQIELREILPENDFESLWIRSFEKFHMAEQEGGLENYRDAKLALTSAIKSPTDSALNQERCRFLLAKVDHRLQNYSEAAKAFLQVSRSFDSVDKQLAAESQWLATRSLIALSKRNPREQFQASQALESIIRRFPGSNYATRAEFESLRINLSAIEPAGAIKRLDAIKPNSLNYPVALNELVKIRYQIWLAAFKARASETPQKLSDLIQSELKYRSLPGVSESSKLKANLLVVDALLRYTKADNAKIRKRLDFAKRITSASRAKADSAYNEYRFYEFLFANSRGDTNSAEKEALWLAENAKGTRFEKSALVQLAQTADQQFRSLSQPTQTQTEQLAGIFEKLVGVLGDTPEIITASPNARVALARLADLKLQSGETKLAIEMLQLLLTSYPNNKTYLQQLGRAYVAAENYSEAIPVWRKLANGTEPGTELWYESKFELANSLLQSGDKASAKILHEQTLRLSPTIPDQWNPRFEELSKKLEKPNR